MSNKKVYMFVPPSHDWGMPLIALPLLKACIPQSIECKIIDINVDIFNYIWGKEHLDCLKKSIRGYLDNNDMLSSVNSSIDLEKKVLFKEIGDREYVLSRKIHIIDEWYDSNKVHDFLMRSS